MAYIWVDKFDPNVSSMIPLERVFQFFHAIGEPLGHYGNTENTGRYLCVREELKRKIQDEVDAPFQVEAAHDKCVRESVIL